MKEELLLLLYEPTRGLHLSCTLFRSLCNPHLLPLFQFKLVRASQTKWVGHFIYSICATFSISTNCNIYFFFTPFFLLNRGFGSLHCGEGGHWEEDLQSAGAEAWGTAAITERLASSSSQQQSRFLLGSLMWAALNKQVGGLEICSLNSSGMTAATTLIWREREERISSWSLQK